MYYFTLLPRKRLFLQFCKDYVSSCRWLIVINVNRKYREILRFKSRWTEFNLRVFVTRSFKWFREKILWHPDYTFFEPPLVAGPISFSEEVLCKESEHGNIEGCINLLIRRQEILRRGKNETRSRHALSHSKYIAQFHRHFRYKPFRTFLTFILL